MSRYTADGRRRSSMAHAKHSHLCSCGRIVAGNGAKSSHGRMHDRAGDGHRYVGRETFDRLFPNWWELPWPERGERKNHGRATHGDMVVIAVDGDFEGVREYIAPPVAGGRVSDPRYAALFTRFRAERRLASGEWSGLNAEIEDAEPSSGSGERA